MLLGFYGVLDAFFASCSYFEESCHHCEVVNKQDMTCQFLSFRGASRQIFLPFD